MHMISYLPIETAMEPPHDVDDPWLQRTIFRSLCRHGWYGLPLVIVKPTSPSNVPVAWTGSHRIAALRCVTRCCCVGDIPRPKWEVPVVWIDQDVICVVADKWGMNGVEVRAGRIGEPLDLRGLVLLTQYGLGESLAAHVLMSEILSSGFYRRIVGTYQQLLDSWDGKVDVPVALSGLAVAYELALRRVSQIVFESTNPWEIDGDKMHTWEHDVPFAPELVVKTAEQCLMGQRFSVLQACLESHHARESTIGSTYSK